jgi:threonine dehydrogenase-like Zn-dependent dehydrogenase
LEGCPPVGSFRRHNIGSGIGTSVMDIVAAVERVTRRPVPVDLTVGRDVTGWTAGDRVTVDPQVACGVCVPCRRGWISICDNKRVTGSSLRGFVQGAMAEYLAVAATQIHRVPLELSYPEAAVVEPLANGLHVVHRSEPRASDVVVVLGAGPLGLCILQCLKAAGVAHVLVTDIADHRLELAARLGADTTVPTARQLESSANLARSCSSVRCKMR